MGEEGEQDHHEGDGSSDHQVPSLVVLVEGTHQDVRNLVLHPDTFVHGEAVISKDVKEGCVEILAHENCQCSVDVVVY